MAVCFFHKLLVREPAVITRPGVTVRTFAGDRDRRAWLKLRTAAMAKLVAAGPEWTTERFDREFTEQPWWNPRHFWLAEPEHFGELRAGAGERRAEEMLGAVALAAQSYAASHASERRSATIHWLMVDPQHRRRGLARALISHAEYAAWRSGIRHLQLQTLASWSEAIGFYEAIGYERDDELKMTN